MKHYPYADAPRLPDDERIDPRQLVSADQIELELGPGRGGFILERLEAVPEVAIIGLEIRLKWAKVVDDRLKARGLGARGRVFAEDGRLALPRFLDGSISRAFLHFPDPWWKKKHAKRRVLTAEMARELCRVLVVGGELFVQTDVPERADDYDAVLRETPGLRAAEPGPRISENPFLAQSPRERRAQADGLPVHRLLFYRDH